MSIPSEERKQVIVSSTSNERQSKGIIVKSTYWVVFSSFGNLHMREFEGSYSLRLSVAAPQFHLTPALDGSLNILSDRFWLWKVDMDDNLDLVEVEPVVNGDPIIHDTTRISAGIVNIRANVRDGYPVNVYCVTAVGSLVLKIYSDIKSAVPDKTVDLDWSPTRLDSFDTVSYDDKVNVAYLDVLSPPNIYTEDYDLSISEITTYVQIGTTLQIQLEWEEVDGAEGYRIERAIDDPLFLDSIIIYSGTNTSFVDDVPSYNTEYYYRTKVEVPSLGIESVWSTSRNVTIGASPLSAEFSADVTSGNASLVVTFTDSSIGSPTGWDWDFGDGTPHSFVQNPIHTYTKADVFTVSLTVSVPGNSNTETKFDYITVNMLANFTADVTSGIPSLSVNFTDSTLGEPDTWDWNFGDGTAHGSSQNPTHIYTKAGVFTVTLVASSTSASDSEIKVGYITTSMVTDFTGVPVTGVVPLTINFTDETVGVPSAWLWDFGDNQNSWIQNPSHVFSAGLFTVSLTASNTFGGFDVETKTAYITVNQAPTIVVQPVSLTINQDGSATFSVTADGYPLNYQWTKDGTDISGATSSTLTIDFVQRSSHGEYSVRVWNVLGSVNSDPASLTVNTRTRVFGMAVLNGYLYLNNGTRIVKVNPSFEIVGRSRMWKSIQSLSVGLNDTLLVYDCQRQVIMRLSDNMNFIEDVFVGETTSPTIDTDAYDVMDIIES
jgi:PKD repeat protein